MLTKGAFAQTQDRMEAEDIVQQTIFRLCFYEAKDEEHLFRLSRKIFRRIIAEYLYKRCNSPIDVAPYEDFYLMEEVLGWCDEDDEAEAQSIQPTADIGEAFLRVAAELTKQLGRKYAAVACGLREKTFARILPS
jgi:DNA-directed RNA polymerase specialized sigma24 family protein